MALAKVMVVEDERVVAMHLRQQLSRLGYEVPAMATKGEQALELIVKHRPDLILMDIHIDGDMDGIDTAARIPAELHIPVIYLTAYSEDSTLERARVTKPYGYLLKPFSERELHASIQMALERHQSDTHLVEETQELQAILTATSDELVVASQEIELQTERRRKAELALSQVQKMEAVGHLTGGLAHDFNNLMHVVVGNLEVIARIAPSESNRLQQATEHALQAARKAVEVTQRLLAFAALQPLAPKAVNVNTLVSGMSDILHRSLEESIGVRTRFGAGVWLVEADPNQLESAVLNLAVNARDAMNGAGNLTIQTHNVTLSSEDVLSLAESSPGSYVAVSVSDTGCGMDEPTLARAFEPFFTTKEIGKGTGLGLSQVYGFVKQSGGFIHLQSEVGTGTTVTLYLPRLHKTAVEERMPVVPVPLRGKGNETILVVEDDDDVRAFSVDMLGELGYRTLEAGDGPSALRILRAANDCVDLLFTDVVLPGGMNGAEVAKEAVAICPELAVLFTSGYDRNVLSQQGRLGTGVELLSKPYAYSELSSRVRDMLDRRNRSPVDPISLSSAAR